MYLFSWATLILHRDTGMTEVKSYLRRPLPQPHPNQQKYYEKHHQPTESSL